MARPVHESLAPISLDSPVKFADDEVDILVHGVAVQLFAFCIFGSQCVAPDDDGAVLAEQAEVVVGPEEAGFGLHSGFHLRCVFTVKVYIVHENGALADSDIHPFPYIVLYNVAGSCSVVVSAAQFVERAVTEEAEQAFIGAGNDITGTLVGVLVVGKI